jgi:septal ring factor EnvC (AmiA/AmiB activator)
MTLYGKYDSLSAEVGDWVEPGEVISSVGQGADRRQGLYFELRREGKAVDPAAWIKR